MTSNKVVVWTYYGAFAFVVFALALFRPHFNWDVLGYSASVKAYETSDPKEIHAFAYGALERVALADTIAELAPTDTNTYRGAVRADADAFAEQLSYYRVRAGYVNLVRLLYLTGVDIVFATYLVSAVSVSLGILVLCAIAQGSMLSPYVYVVPLLALLAGTLELAKSSSPDGLAFLGVVLAAYLFLRGHPLVFAVLPLLITVRADLVLFCIPMLLYLATARRQRLAAALSGAAVIGVYLGLGMLYGHPKWTTLIYVSNVGGMPNPLTAPPDFSLALYLTLVAKGVYAMTIDRAFLAFAVSLWFGVFAVRLLKRTPGESGILPRDPMEALFYASVVYCASHFVLLPLLWERYFTAHYLLAEVALLALWSQRQAQPRPEV